MRARAALLLVAIAGPIVGRATPAHANAADLFGLGAASSAQAGAVSASVDDWSSAYYNPAGLGFGTGTQVSLGVQATRAALSINGVAKPVTEPVGVTVGATLPAPVKGWLAGKLRLGIALYVLPTEVLHVIARLPNQAFFPYYDDRSQRLVVLPALALRVHPKVAVGVAANFLAGVGGAVVTDSGQTRALEPRVDESVFATVRVNAGVRVEAGSGVSTALVYRQAFSVPFTTSTRNHVAGDEIDLDIDAEGLYSPHTVVGGVAWRAPSGAVTADLDLAWAAWSAFRGPYVQVTSRIPFVGPLAGRLPKVAFKDTYAARAGLSVRAAEGPGWTADVRGGGSVETSMLPAQTGITNLVDGTKIGLALGGGLRYHGVSVDLHLGIHLVPHTSVAKRVFGPGETGDPAVGLKDERPDMAADPTTQGVQISNPGYPTLGGGGYILAGGLTFGVEL